MNIVKRNFNLLLLLSVLTLSICNFIICKYDYIYRPKSYTLFLIVYLIINILITYFSVKYRKFANRLSIWIGSFMPIVSVFYSVTMLMCFDTEINYVRNNTFYFSLLFVIPFTCSLILFFVYNKVKWFKVCIAIITYILAHGILYILLFSFLFSNFGENTVTQILNSTENTNTAYFISSNHGALGGQTLVCVRNVKKDIPLLSGELRTGFKILWTGLWEEEPVIQWYDDNNIMIEDVIYEADTLSNAEISDEWEIKLTPKNVTNTGMTICFEHKGDKHLGDITTDEVFEIEKYIDGDWEYIDKKVTNHTWNVLEYRINKNDTTKLDVNWSFLYGELTPGKYRLSKNIMGYKKGWVYDKETFHIIFNIE